MKRYKIFFKPKAIRDLKKIPKLEDYNDLKLLRDAKLKEKDLPLIDIEEVKIDLGIKD